MLGSFATPGGDETTTGLCGSFGSHFFHFLMSSVFPQLPVRHCGYHISQPPVPDPLVLSSLGTLDWVHLTAPSLQQLSGCSPLFEWVGVHRRIFSQLGPRLPVSLHSPPIQPAPSSWSSHSSGRASGPSAPLPPVVLLRLSHRPVQPFHRHRVKIFLFFRVSDAVPRGLPLAGGSTEHPFIHEPQRRFQHP